MASEEFDLTGREEKTKSLVEISLKQWRRTVLQPGSAAFQFVVSHEEVFYVLRALELEVEGSFHHR